MKEIILTQGQVAIVDDEDYVWLSQWNWYALFNKVTNSFYAVRHLPWTVGTQRRSVWMHREILGLKHGDKRQGDHRESGRTLDNRRANLRIASPSQNSFNRRAERDTVAGLKGVSPEKGNWRARIYVNGKRRHLGLFPTKQQANDAYRDAAIQFFGEFAREK